MVDHGWIDTLLDPADRANCRKYGNWRSGTSPKRNRVEGKTFRANGIFLSGCSGCDMNIKAGFTSGSSHWKTVRQENPVF